MKRIVIVGATSGIGYEVAKLYCEMGYRVGVAGRREELLNEMKQNAPNQIETEIIDVTSEDAPAGLQSLIQKLGGMDVFLLSSGVGKQNRNLVFDIEENTMETNVLGFSRMVITAYHYFTNQGYGQLAVISSIAGTKGLGVAPAYSATKCFQNVYIDALAQLSRIEKQNIHFTDIRPGFVRTAILSDKRNYPMLMKPEKVAQSIVKAIKKRKRRVVIDIRYRIIVFFWRLIPNFIWERIRVAN